MNRNSPNVYVVGAVDNPLSRIIRIVHISGTMGCEDKIKSQIPFGHILIHSGDFGRKNNSSANCVIDSIWKSRALSYQIERMNKFFSELPHPHKIYVPCQSKDSLLIGNNNCNKVAASLEKSVTFIESGIINLYSLKLTVVPAVKRRLSNWIPTLSSLSASTHNANLSDNWVNVPEDTDVIISQDYPWNSVIFNNVVTKIKPMLHLYSKNDGNYGVLFRDGIVFSNASYRSFNKYKNRLKLADRGSSYFGHSNFDYDSYYPHRSSAGRHSQRFNPTTSSFDSLNNNNNSFNSHCSLFCCRCFPCLTRVNHHNNRHKHGSFSASSHFSDSSKLPNFFWCTGDSYQPLVFDVYVPPKRELTELDVVGTDASQFHKINGSDSFISLTSSASLNSINIDE